MGELNRMTQFKDKTRGGEAESIGVGIFDYPVLMAADILLYRADAVPVGEDQKQHVELTRDLAERFNNAFGKTFVVPEPIIRTEGARIMGLDDPAKKMSKSADSAYNFIALTDSPDDIRRKIKRAVTDSGAEVRPDPDKPALTNLLTIYSMLAGETVDTVVARYDGQGYAQFKKDLAEVVVDALAPFQRRMKELGTDKGFTLDVLRDGAERAARHRRAHHAEGARPHGVRAPPVSHRALVPPPGLTTPRRTQRRRPRSLAPSESAPSTPTASAPARKAPGRVELVEQAAGVGRARVVVGGKGAGRFGPPPSRQSRHAEQRQQRRRELACVGARQRRRRARSRSSRGSTARGSRAVDAGGSGRRHGQAQGSAPIQRELDHAQAGPRRRDERRRRVDRVVVGVAALVGRHVDGRPRCLAHRSPAAPALSSRARRVDELRDGGRDGRDVLDGVLVGEVKVAARWRRQAERARARGPLRPRAAGRAPGRRPSPRADARGRRRRAPAAGGRRRTPRRRGGRAERGRAAPPGESPLGRPPPASP